MEKLIPIKMSRQAWGYVLFFGAVISLLAAVGSPLSYVGALVCVKLGLFGFWPAFSKKAALVLPPAAGAAASSNKEKIRALSLHDQRVDGSLFQHNVPSFVLNHEQRFLARNAAFELVFGGEASLTKTSHVTAWFELLDNYKRVSKRQEKLFGEGILPLTDRERATYVSPRFGRMVFTKIMSPIIDRRTGKILGWNVVLNVNSVSKREEFFEALYAVLATETRRVRYASALDGVFRACADYKKLLAVHLAALAAPTPQRILEIGGGPGLLTRKLLRDGHRVTLVESEAELLRKARDRSGDVPLTLVHRDLAALGDLPAARFDHVSVTFSAHKVNDLGQLLAGAFHTLKPGGRLVLSSLVAGASPATLFAHVRESLESAGAYEQVKHQLHHVEEWETAEAATPRSLDELKVAAEAAGFIVDRAEAGFLGGTAAVLVARRA